MVSRQKKQKNQEDRGAQIGYANYLLGLLGRPPESMEFYDKFGMGDLPPYIIQLRYVCRDNEIEFEEESDYPKPKPNGYANGHSNGHVNGHADEGDKRLVRIGQGYKILTPIDAIVDTTIIHSDYRLLALLINYAGKNGYLWYSEQSLADNSIGPGGKKGVSVKTIERGLQRLATGNDQRGPYIEILTPDQSKARGYNTYNSRSNTIVINVDSRQEFQEDPTFLS